MGNQHSASDGDSRPARPFGRSGGALGLSKSELDKRCQPSGLYDSCPWDDKAVRKLVGDGRVVARLKGCEHRTPDINQECPICFLYYSEINVTKCCSANLCTECYLQVRPQKEKHSTCPFCNNHKLSIAVAKKLSEEQIAERDREEQKVEKARIRAKSIDEEKPTEQDTPDNSSAPNKDGFGSCLEQDTRVALLRARSESFASSEASSSNEENIIHTLAMSPEERRRLEEEMRAQHSHPLALRLEAEAAERRLQNDRAFYRSNSDSARRARAVDMFRHGSSSRRRGRGQSSRDWNQIVEAWERGGNGEVQSLDDLVVLEAAILLSMDEETRRSRDEGEDFDAARHAREGFPLVRTFLANRREDGSSAATPEQLQSLARNLSSNRRRNQLLRATNGRAARSTSSMPDTAMDTAAMLMRGISEEEQIAMAIAASLQEQTNAEGENANAESGGSEQASRPAEADQSEELLLCNGQTAVVGVVVEEDDEEDDDGEAVAEGIGVGVGVAVEDDSEVEEQTLSSSNQAEGVTPAPLNSDVSELGDTTRCPVGGRMDTGDNPSGDAPFEAGIPIESQTDAGTENAIPIEE